MRTSPAAQCTDFARDILGRFVCNGLDEALCSADGQLHSDPRPFDLIILGGGAIGAALAHQLFVADRAHNHRTLLLEAGPFTIPDHVQNLPMLGLAVPEPSSIADLRTRGQHATARDEVWGLPWHSDETFPGLAYCLGGRSLFSGGWSPSPLDGELQAWPAEVAESLSDHYFAPAAQQMGVHLRNDFLNGDLHKALRLRLFQGLRGVRGAIPPREIPHHLAHPPSARPHDVSKLDAPLAVQASERSGRHPLRRFSGVPALIQAARAAWVESDGDDARKRLMIVPHCHVERLITENGRVKWVQTNQGSVPVLNRGRVILALGTIESARLALESFAGMAHADQIGRHLMAHLRSTVVIRLPYESLPQ
jgi:choline dehydrogenase-like flavoprotein